jgi:hypothetical protein
MALGSLFYGGFGIAEEGQQGCEGKGEKAHVFGGKHSLP